MLKCTDAAFTGDVKCFRLPTTAKLTGANAAFPGFRSPTAAAAPPADSDGPNDSVCLVGTLSSVPTSRDEKDGRPGDRGRPSGPLPSLGTYHSVPQAVPTIENPSRPALRDTLHALAIAGLSPAEVPALEEQWRRMESA